MTKAHMHIHLFTEIKSVSRKYWKTLRFFRKNLISSGEEKLSILEDTSPDSQKACVLPTADSESVKKLEINNNGEGGGGG